MKPGWKTKRIGEVCRLIGGGTPSKERPEFYSGSIPWATVRDMRSDILTTTEFKITKEAVKKSATNIIPAENVVIATRVGLGKVCFINQDTAINQDLKGIVPFNTEALNVSYLFWWFKTIAESIIAAGTGATVQGVKLEFVKNLSIPVPPLPEQKRIVAILDEAFAGIAIAKANAEKNLQNARELFESYLNEVFNGLSHKWEEKSLKEITTHLGDGLHGTPKYSDDGECFFINGNNLVKGKIVFKENTKRVSYSEFEKHRKNLNNKTILVSINGTLGNVAFYSNEKIVLGKSACYFNLIEGVDKYFIKYIISSPFFFRYAHREATGATIKNVSLKSMREFKVPLPSLRMQNAIVAKLDFLRNQIDRFETIYQQKLAALDELKKALLHKAFSGEL